MPLPVPLLPAVTVNQVALLVAVQVQLLDDGATVIVPVLLLEENDAVVGEMLYVQAKAPLWVTVCVCPPTVMVPVRELVNVYNTVTNVYVTA